MAMLKFLLVFGLLFTGLVHAESEKKVVCHVDENDKNKKQICKTIRVHHKAEKVTQGSPTDPEPKKSKK